MKNNGKILRGFNVLFSAVETVLEFYSMIFNKVFVISNIYMPSAAQKFFAMTNIHAMGLSKNFRNDKYTGHWHGKGLLLMKGLYSQLSN